MVKNYLSRSCTMRSATSSCNPAYQVRRSITHALLRAAAICHSRLQTRIAGAWHQINQHSRSVNMGRLFSAAPRPSVFNAFLWNRALATIACTFFRPHHLPKVLRAPSASGFLHVEVQMQIETFCRELSQIEARNRGNRDPTSATPGATLPEKTQGFAPESVSIREFARFWTLTLPNCLMIALTWWRGWHDDVVDMMVWMLTMTIVCT